MWRGLRRSGRKTLEQCGAAHEYSRMLVRTSTRRARAFSARFWQVLLQYRRCLVGVRNVRSHPDRSHRVSQPVPSGRGAAGWASPRDCRMRFSKSRWACVFLMGSPLSDHTYIHSDPHATWWPSGTGWCARSRSASTSCTGPASRVLGDGRSKCCMRSLTSAESNAGATM